ncbi:DUF6056 family protein [Paenibacillus terrae]|uniref:DUF6056 family protein n=1 Tax=Paenibacillus terrae TaxID=159743 RepID=UPI0011EA7950|nr:DUF6056 family protein [Paenibacillus terrae]
MGKLKNKQAWGMFLFFILVYGLHFVISAAPGDDTWFMDISQKYSFIDYLFWRYSTWSGRIYAEANLYIFLDGKIWIWRLVNSMILVATSYLLVRIVQKKVTLFNVLVAFLAMGFCSKSVLSSSFFWITGSINYLWPICFALIAVLPYADIVFRNESVKLRILVTSSLFGFLAACSNEQVALCLICFSLLSHLTLTFKRVKNVRLAIPSVMFGLGAAILFIAPGSQLRFVAEVNRWFPGFDSLPLKDHIYIGSIWMFEKLFIELKGIIILLSLISIVSIYKSSRVELKDDHIIRYSFIEKFLLIDFAFVVVLHLIGPDDSIFFSFDKIKSFSFHQSLLLFWDSPLSFWFALVPYVFWSIYAFCLAYVLFKLSPNKAFTFFCLTAALFSMIVMFFSPTIYASGSRVLSVSAVLFIIVTIHLLNKNNIINTKLGLCLFGVLPIYNLISLFCGWIVNGYSPIL